MLEVGDEKALGKLLALLSYDTGVAQETKEVLWQASEGKINGSQHFCCEYEPS